MSENKINTRVDAANTPPRKLGEEELADIAGGSGSGPRDCYFHLQGGDIAGNYSKKEIGGVWRFKCTKHLMLHLCNGHTCACFGKHCEDGWHLADMTNNILLPESHSNHAKKNQDKQWFE